MSSTFQVTAVVESVTAAYEGYGEARKLKGVTVKAVYSLNGTEFTSNIEVPQSSLDSYPTVGDDVLLTVG